MCNRVKILLSGTHSRGETSHIVHLYAVFTKLTKAYQLIENTRCVKLCISRRNAITPRAISLFAVYEIFQTENGSALPTDLCFTISPRQTRINKQTQKQVSLLSMWRRGTSNPAVFSHVRLSQVAERRRQTKPQSYADANESHRIAPAAVP